MNKQKIPRLSRRQRKWLKARWKELQQGPREWTEAELLYGCKDAQKPQGVLYAKGMR